MATYEGPYSKSKPLTMFKDPVSGKPLNSIGDFRPESEVKTTTVSDFARKGGIKIKDTNDGQDNG